VLVLIAVLAYFQVQGTAALISALLVTHSRASTAPKLEASPQAPSPPLAPPLVRNPFNSTPKPPSVDLSDPLSWPSCDDVRVLIVTESKDPTWSLATLHAPSEPRARLRRVGDGFAGQKVAFIGFNPRQQTPAVWLEGKDQACQSPLFGAGPTIAAAPPKPSERVPEPATQQGGLFRQLRVVPELLNGKVVGLRLFGVRPGSLLATLGLKNGDRLETINGFSLANPEQALQAYAKLRTAEHLRLQLTRAGQPLQIDLHIS